MTLREAAPSREHQALVGRLVKWIVAEEFQIDCANYGDYQSCGEVKGFIPDAKGYRKDIELRCFGESKTADDIDNDHTKNQFSEFAHRIMTSGKSKDKKCPFYITIEEGSESDLKNVLKELDLLGKPHVKWQAFQV